MVAFDVLSAPAHAFTVVQNEDNLLTELLGETPGLSNFTLTKVGDDWAFGVFNNSPFQGLESGVVLSTGQVIDLPGENTEDDGFLTFLGLDLDTDFGPPGSAGDSITLDITFEADDTADRLFFNYVFDSEEFLEFAGDSFNDAFELLLNGVNLALLSNGDLVTVNNLAASPAGPFNPDYVDNPAGPGTVTKLDGFTKVLEFEGPLIKNAQNTLSINIRDVEDGRADSAVFVKGGSITTVPPTTDPPKAVPEPGIAIGLGVLSLVAFYPYKRRKCLEL